MGFETLGPESGIVYVFVVGCIGSKLTTTCTVVGKGMRPFHFQKDLSNKSEQCCDSYPVTRCTHTWLPFCDA